MKIPVFVLAGIWLAGCATLTGEDPNDPCGAARAELRNAQNYYVTAVLTGVAKGLALGGIAGAITGAITGQDVKKSALIGGVGGGVIGGIGAYYQAKSQVTTDAAALSDSVLKDVVAENSEIDKATLAFAKLRDCRFTAARQVKAEYAAGRISRTQATSQLNDLQRRFDQDVAIAEEIGAKMAEKSKEFDYAANQLVAANPEAQAYLQEYPIVNETPARTGAPARGAGKSTTRTGSKVVTRPPVKSKPPAKRPAPKAPPAARVAQETNTNQDKQKKYADEVAVAKTEAGQAFALEGKVGVLDPAAACRLCAGA